MPLSKQDTARIFGYDRLQRVYRNKHAAVFDLDGDDQFPTVTTNYANAIIDGLSGLIASKSPTFKLNTSVAQTRLDEIIEASSFGTELLQFVTQGLLFGDSVFKVFVGRDGQVKIRCLSPKAWYVEPDPEDADSILSHNLFSIKKSASLDLMLIERHVAGFITNEIFIVSKGKIIRSATIEEIARFAPEWLTKPPVVETGVDEPLVVSWSHDKLCGDLYGTSELETIWDLIRSADNRKTQIHRVLDKHADPKMILEEGTFDRDTEGNVVIRNLDVIIVPQGSSKEQLGYITWDGKLDAANDAYKQDIEDQLHITQVSRLLLNADQTQAQTGEAFKIQLFPSILKATHIQKSLEGVLRTTMRVAQKLAIQSGGRKFTPSPIEISWGVELPMNEQSMVQAAAQKVETGISSVQEVRKELDNRNKL